MTGYELGRKSTKVALVILKYNCINIWRNWRNLRRTGSSVRYVKLIPSVLYHLRTVANVSDKHHARGSFSLKKAVRSCPDWLTNNAASIPNANLENDGKLCVQWAYSMIFFEPQGEVSRKPRSVHTTGLIQVYVTAIDVKHVQGYSKFVTFRWRKFCCVGLCSCISAGTRNTERRWVTPRARVQSHWQQPISSGRLMTTANSENHYL